MNKINDAKGVQDDIFMSATAPGSVFTSATEIFPTDITAREGEEGQLDEECSGEMNVEYTMNPAFPNLPSSVPLTYTLVTHACLSASPVERPTFAEVSH